VAAPQTTFPATEDVTSGDASASRKLFLFRLTTALVACTLAAAAGELLSYGFFRRLERTDRTLRIFSRPRHGGMPIAVKPRFTQHWTAPEFAVDIHTNSLGLREDFELPAGRRIDVAFLGDSFTFGHGVEARHRYSDRVRALLGQDQLVVSLSYANGWTTPHYFLFLRENPALVPRVAVVGLFVGNDLSADMRESKLITNDDGDLIRVETPLRDVDELGHLVTRDRNRVSSLARRTWTGRLLLYLNAHGQLDLAALRPSGAFLPGWQQPALDAGALDANAYRALGYLRALRDLLRARDGELVVVLIPWSFYVAEGYPSPYPPSETATIRSHLALLKSLAGWCESAGIVCVDPVPALRAAERRGERTYYRQDAHWTPFGHRIAAAAIIDEVRAALARTR
jgi:hypothetical protein